MYITCQDCKNRIGECCKLDGDYAEPNHIYGKGECTKEKKKNEK